MKYVEGRPRSHLDFSEVILERSSQSERVPGAVGIVAVAVALTHINEVDSVKYRASPARVWETM